MATTHEIHLYRQGGVWVARDNDPQVRALFGTDTLPTAFQDTVLGAEVSEAIKVLNPSAVITRAIYPGEYPAGAP